MEKNKKHKLCPHGCLIGSQGGIVQSEINSYRRRKEDEAGLLEYYSACDCCDILMHHDAIGKGYFVMKDGRTLCSICVTTEDPKDIDQ